MQLAPVLDVDQAAALCRCAPSTVQELARDGQLPGLQLGRDWVFPTEALLQRLNALAIEQAAARRDPPKPSGQLVDIKAAGAGDRRGRRAPPKLPAITPAAPPGLPLAGSCT